MSRAVTDSFNALEHTEDKISMADISQYNQFPKPLDISRLQTAEIFGFSETTQPSRIIMWFRFKDGEQTLLAGRWFRCCVGDEQFAELLRLIDVPVPSIRGQRLPFSRLKGKKVLIECHFKRNVNGRYFLRANRLMKYRPAKVGSD